MSRPFLLLLLITALFVGLIGFSWLQLPPSNQELLANYAKVQDYANQASKIQGLPWWTTSFLQGSSLAFMSIGALTNLSIYLVSLVAGPYAGTKLLALAFLALCPLTMYAFIKRLCPASGWTAFACGSAYLFAPSILLRLGHVEHIGNVLAFALLPLAFRSVLVFFEERNTRSALICAASNALMVLSYVKIAVLVFPLLLAFALWVWITRAQFTLPSWKNIFLCVGVFVLLAVFPNLPTLRENQFVVKFDLGPFAAWQANYSLKSALAWMDRDSFLSGAPGSRQSEVQTGSAYLGIVNLFCVATLCFLRRRPAWLTEEASAFRLFLALALTAHWIGFGVNNALLGQLAFLSSAGNALDPAIAVSWGLLVLQGVAIYLILPGSLPSRVWWAAGAILIYFLVPGFRILEKFPLYQDIRAPHDFFEMGGVFCFSIAAGIAGFLIVKEISFRKLRIPAAATLLALAGADGSTIVPSFFKAPMDRATFDDFLSAQKFLREDPLPGTVMPFSGRYFYLLTPVLSGRPIINEAFTSHLMARGVAELQSQAFSSKRNLSNFLKIAGISYLLIDKKDPDTSKELQEALREHGQVAFENDHFVVLKNPEAFAPAGLATTYALRGEDTPANINLVAASQGIATISDRTAFGDNAGQVELDAKAFSSFAKVSGVDWKTSERAVITPPTSKGWLWIPEAWHPDWQAQKNDRPVELAKAFGGYIGLRLDGTPEAITLEFHHPFWYDLVVWLSLASWLIVGSLLGAERLSLLPSHWKTALNKTPSAPPPSNQTKTSPAAAIARPLLIIPTYNEVQGISSVLEKALASHPNLQILVVDDASPDGTQAKVRSLPEFSKRIHLLERPGKLGLGSAYKDGFAWALKNGYDACLEMDADLSHDPADIPRLISALDKGADAAIASRYLDGVRVLNWPQDRLFLSLGASKFVRALTGLPLTDATSGFKALRAQALERLDWKKFTAEGYGFQVELHYFLWKSGAHLVEVPIVFTERREGNTKMTTGIAIEALGRVIRLSLTGK